MEYKFIKGSQSECQKWLNQWKHEFNVEIISVHWGSHEVSMLIIRTRKIVAQMRGDDMI